MAIYDITTYGTLAGMVQNLAQMVGFPKPADPAGSEDPAVQQMVAAVNMAGADMMNLYDWQQMIKTTEIPIIANGSRSRFGWQPSF